MVAAANDTRCAAAEAAQQQLATEKATHQKAVEAVHQRGAAAALAATSVNQKELVDDKAIAAVGSKRSQR